MKKKTTIERSFPDRFVIELAKDGFNDDCIIFSDKEPDDYGLGKGRVFVLFNDGSFTLGKLSNYPKKSRKNFKKGKIKIKEMMQYGKNRTGH